MYLKTFLFLTYMYSINVCHKEINALPHVLIRFLLIRDTLYKSWSFFSVFNLIKSDNRLSTFTSKTVIYYAYKCVKFVFIKVTYSFVL